MIGCPIINPCVGVRMNTERVNPSMSGILTLLVRIHTPKIMKNPMIPHNRVGVIPVAKYPGQMFGAMLSIEKCRALMFLNAFPNVGVGITVTANRVKDLSFPHPVESHAL